MDRQRILTIFGVAWISAALLTWFLYSRTKAPKEEKTVKVVAAVRDLPAGHKVTKDDLRLVSVAEKDAPKASAQAPEELIGRALLYPISANEAMSTLRVTPLSGAEGAAAIIEPGKRAVSVPFTDATGASGLIQPKSHVDVLFTRTGNAVEAMTVTVLEDVEVLSIGTRVQVEQQAPGTTAKATTVTPGQQRTATLMVTPEQAVKLELAKNQGKIGLSLRNPMDRSLQAEPSPATMEKIDPLLLTRTSQGLRRGGRVPAGVKDPKAWAQLIGEEEPRPAAPPKPVEKKEPPKPRAVIDVYRGDKHVQDIFQ